MMVENTHFTNFITQWLIYNLYLYDNSTKNQNKNMSIIFFYIRKYA